MFENKVPADFCRFDGSSPFSQKKTHTTFLDEAVHRFTQCDAQPLQAFLRMWKSVNQRAGVTGYHIKTCAFVQKWGIIMAICESSTIRFLGSDKPKCHGTARFLCGCNGGWSGLSGMKDFSEGPCGQSIQ